MTAGAVDLLLGGLQGRASLMLFGAGVTGVAIALQWWRNQQRPSDSPTRQPPPQRYLSAQSSRPPVPMMGLSSRRDDNPPHR